MKKNICMVLILICIKNYGQISIAPINVVLDQNKRVANFYVKNVGDKEQEVSVRTDFGYPVYDSLGDLTMLYLSKGDLTPKESSLSIDDQIKNFPGKFFIKPDKKQLVKFIIRPEPELADGLYWTRIITTSEEKEEFSPPEHDEATLKAKIKLKIEQVSYLFFKKGVLKNEFHFDSIYTSADSHFVRIYVKMNQNGNGMFLGKGAVRVSDEAGNLIFQKSERFNVYKNVLKVYPIPKEKFTENKNYYIGVTVFPGRKDLGVEYENLKEKYMKIESFQINE